MTEAELLHAIHADVREIRATVATLVSEVAHIKGAHEVRLQDLEAHMNHTGPTKWDTGSILGALGAVIISLMHQGK